MINLKLIDSILSDKFKVNGKLLEEVSQKMKVVFETRGSLSYLCYKYDDNLKGYSGGLFPFYSYNLPNVHSIVDYIIFVEFKSKLYVLLFELKAGKADTWIQFNSASVFVDFIIRTAERITKSSNCIIEKRYISVREYQIKKGNTRMKSANFKNSHYQLKHSNFCLNDLINE